MKTKIFVAFLAVILALTGFMGYSIYKKKSAGILPDNIYINNIPCGGMALGETKAFLINSYNMNDVVLTINGREYTYPISSLAELNVDSIDNFNIPLSYYFMFGENHVTLDYYKVNRDMVKSTLGSLIKDEPKNAKIKYKNGEFSIREEIYQGNLDDIYTELDKKISLGKIDITRFVTAPTKFAEGLIDECDKRNNYINEDTKFSNIPESITTDIKKSHIVKNKIDYSWIDEYVNNLYLKYSTAGGTHEFTDVDGNTFEVVGGTYGWLMDSDATKARVMSDLKKGKNKTKAVFTQEANIIGSADIGDTYVEVSIPQQTIKYVKKGKVKLQSACVTGKMTKKRHTYTGVYSVIEKRKDTYLKGATWNTHVMYFMLFNYAGQGFHDATWRSAFGGNIYVRNGSHGCVNLPYSAAEDLYSKIDVGTPVVIH